MNLSPIRADQIAALQDTDTEHALANTVQAKAATHYKAQAALATKPRHPGQLSGWLARIPADALLAEAQALAAELALLKGHGHNVQRGCTLVTMPLGDAEVLVEFEHTPASGDGWNEPREEASTVAIQVLVNGVFIDASHFAESVVQTWEEVGAADYAESVNDAMAERAEREREFA